MRSNNMAEMPHVSTVMGGGAAGMAAHAMDPLGMPGGFDGTAGLGPDYRQMLAGPNDTLMAQYQKCGQFNNEQLKNAKNLEQLVAIDIQSVDGALAAGAVAQGQSMQGFQVRGGARRQRGYDPLHDPRHFPQPVPSMATRKFLMNQAVLASSAPSYRLRQPGRGVSDGQVLNATDSRSAAGLGATGNSLRGSEAFSQGPGKAALGSRLNDVASPNSTNQQPRNAQAEAEAVEESATGAELSHELDQDGLTAEDAKELADPIKALKSIFKQKPKKKRAPLELNHVMNKYRQMSLRNGKGGAAKVFKEDYVMSSQLSGDHQVGHESRTLLQGAQGQKSNWQQQEKMIKHERYDYEQSNTMQEELGDRQPYHLLGDPGFAMTQPPLSTKNLNVKERLENLRKLFAEEDMQEAVRDIQHEWIHEEHKADQQRLGSSAHLSTQAHSHGGGQAVMPEDLDLPVHDLRRYLTTKIKSMQDRSDPKSLGNGQLVGHLPAADEDQNSQKPRVQFKASTLTHIAELRAVGQEKIESQFIERLFREQTDYHYDKYAYLQQKEQSKKASEEVRRRALRAGASVRASLQQTGVDQFQGNEPFTPTSGSRSTAGGDPADRRRRQGKTVNILQQQLMKINRIDRGVERLQRESRGELPLSQQHYMEEAEPYVAASSVTAAVPQDEPGGSMETNFTHSEMAALGNAAAAAGRRHSPPKRSGQMELGQPLLENRRQEDERQASPGLHAVAPAPPAAEPLSIQQPHRSQDDVHAEQQMSDEQVANQQQSPSAAGLSQGKQSTGSKGRRSKDRTALPMASPQIGAAVFDAAGSKATIPSLQAAGLDELRVSQMIREYNMRQPDSPTAYLAAGDATQYMSDTDLFLTRRNFRRRAGLDSRGGGFRQKKRADAQVSDAEGSREAGFKYAQTKEGRRRLAGARWPVDQLDGLPEEQIALTHGSQFQYFCPKRFNRYPRFTIFFKRDQVGGNEANPYVTENTVSLSPQFLSYLMDRGAAAKGPQPLGPEDKERPVVPTTRDGSFGSQKASPRTTHKEENTDLSKLAQPQQSPVQLGPVTHGSTLQAEDAVTAWNQNHELVQNYDPFERVVLVKGIDNQILTSFRTLKRENNTVSDTFKIVHQKFLPSKNRGLYFKSMKKNHADKFGGLYSLTDNEEALEIAQAELLAESFLQQAEDSQVQHKAGLEAGLVDKSALHSDANTTQLDGDDGAGKPQRHQALAKPVQLASLIQGAVDPGVQRSRDPRAAAEQTGASRESSVGPVGLRPAGAEPDNQRFDYAMQKGKAAGKVDEDPKRQRVIRKGLGPSKAVAPYSYGLGSGGLDGAIAEQYGAEEKNMQAAAATAYAQQPGAMKTSAGLAGAGSDLVHTTGKPNTQIKHQIQVKLSKVDPYRSAFPGSALPESGHLGNSFHNQGLVKKQGGVVGMPIVGGAILGPELALLSGQPPPVQYPGMTTATKRTVPHKGLAAGAAPSDRAAPPGGQGASTGRGGKKQLALRGQTHGSAKARTFVAGQSYGADFRQPAAAGANRDGGEPSASGQPPTQGAPSTDAGGRLDSIRMDDTFQNAKKKGKGWREEHGAGDAQRGADGDGEPVSKYGKDFKIPELPPLLQAQLFGPTTQDEWSHGQQRPGLGGIGFGVNLGGHKPYKIKRFIDEMYQKEAKSRYHRQYVREDFLLTQSPIFDLQKYHNLRPQGELMPRGGRNRFGGLDSEVGALGVDKKGNPVFPSESQSLTNVMGFQAGGVSLLSPHNAKAPNPELQLQIMGQLNSHSDLPSLAGQHLDANAQLWNRGHALGDGTPPQLASPAATHGANPKNFTQSAGGSQGFDTGNHQGAPLGNE